MGIFVWFGRDGRRSYVCGLGGKCVFEWRGKKIIRGNRLGHTLSRWLWLRKRLPLILLSRKLRMALRRWNLLLTISILWYSPVRSIYRLRRRLLLLNIPMLIWDFRVWRVAILP